MKIELSSKKSILFMLTIVVGFLGIIHFQFDNVIQYVDSKFNPFFQLVMLMLILIFAIVILPMMDLYRTNDTYSTYWKSLKIEFTLSGVYKLLSIILNCFIFSISLYIGMKFLFVSYADLLTGQYVEGRFSSVLILAPIVVVIVIAILIGIKIFEKIGMIDKNYFNKR